jgi:hypothetical protein
MGTAPPLSPMKSWAGAFRPRRAASTG